MGYDVTLHPVNRKEFKYFIEEVFNEPHLMDTKAAAIHNKEQERVFLVKSVYSNFPKFKEQLLNKSSSVEKTIGFAATAILGYLQPFWYLRNGLISSLLSDFEFKEMTSNLSSIVEEENKVFFDSENGVDENYSSGVFIPYQNIPTLLEKLRHAEFKNKIIEAIGEENLNSFICCLDYCNTEKLDLLESTDLYVPLSGEFYTFPSNAKALHLKNTSDYSNFSQKNIPFDFGESIDPAEINKDWWNNLSDNWREQIRISYQETVRPIFKENHKERNLHVETKFNIESLDLTGIDELEGIGIRIIDRNNNYSTITPFFDFPRLKKIRISTSFITEFDLRRILQFPQIEKLNINEFSIVKTLIVSNLSSLRELNNLRHLKLGETQLKASDLKELNRFTQLISLSLFLAPYRSISFLKGNKYLEALLLSYTKGLEGLPNLRRLHLFPKEKQPTIKNCPNIELINCSNAKRMKDLSSFVHLTKLETLIIKNSYVPIDLTLLSQMPSVRSFYVDKSTNLDSLSGPIDFIENIIVPTNLEKKKQDLAKMKFPNGEITAYIHIPYE